eukprot:ctg_90.g40
MQAGRPQRSPSTFRVSREDYSLDSLSLTSPDERTVLPGSARRSIRIALGAPSAPHLSASVRFYSGAACPLPGSYVELDWRCDQAVLLQSEGSTALAVADGLHTWRVQWKHEPHRDDAGDAYRESLVVEFGLPEERHMRGGGDSGAFDLIVEVYARMGSAMSHQRQRIGQAAILESELVQAQSVECAPGNRYAFCMRRPLVNDLHRIVGELSFAYLIIEPYRGPHAEQALQLARQREARTASPGAEHPDVLAAAPPFASRLVGHRGAGGRGTTVLQENTVLSFLSAVRGKDVCAIELDVQLTRDGVPVIHHDFFVPDAWYAGGSSSSSSERASEWMPRWSSVSAMEESLNGDDDDDDDDDDDSDAGTGAWQRVSAGRFGALSPWPGRPIFTMTLADWQAATERMLARGCSAADELDYHSDGEHEMARCLRRSASRRVMQRAERPGKEGVGVAPELPSSSSSSSATWEARLSFVSSADTASSHARSALLPAPPPQPSTTSRPELRDTMPTLAQALQQVPPHVHLLIEIKYPTPSQLAEWALPFPERNYLVDCVLAAVCEGTLGHHAGDAAERASRRVSLLSFDPEVCLLLRRKQSLYQVLFLCSEDRDDDVVPEDWRRMYADGALAFARSVDLAGVVFFNEILLEGGERLVRRAREVYNLRVMCYGRSNSMPERAAQLIRWGVDGVIADNVGCVARTLVEYLEAPCASPRHSS